MRDALIARGDETQRGMMRRAKTKYLVIAAGLGLLVSFPAPAATRTVQFSGLMGAEYTTTVGTDSDFGYCQVAVVNTGTTSQVVDRVNFIGYDLNSKHSLPGSNPDQQMLRTTTGAGATCIGAQLPPGSFCLFRFANQSIPMDGRYMSCSGDIQVHDYSPDQPGSVVAAGSVTLFQEQLTWGGTLSGAVYMSGTHLYIQNGQVPANVAAFSLDPLSTNYAITNMNFYCAYACNQYGSGMTMSQCVEHCGGGTSAETGEWVAPAASDPGSGSSVGYINTSTNWNNGNPAPACYPSSNQYMPAAILRMPNPHYAGGLVIETTTGPFNQICSGNAAYWNTGGDEFSHADGVDTHSIIAGNSGYPNAPPERLLCQHRHLKDDLAFRVSSTASFVINGGKAF